jgi:hypothetical protein
MRQTAAGGSGPGDVFHEDFVGTNKLWMFLSSAKRYLPLIGYSKLSPAYKGYDVVWTALFDMPLNSKQALLLLIFGDCQGVKLTFQTLWIFSEVPEHVLPILYLKAFGLIKPSQYEGFGMHPIEEITYGCQVILGLFYENKMQYVNGSNALYAGNVK